MYLRAPSRCGGRRPGERCERPARVREPRGGRAGGVAGGAGGRRCRRRGRSERAAALGDGRARFKGPDLTAGSSGGRFHLPPFQPAVRLGPPRPSADRSYRRMNRRLGDIF